MTVADILVFKEGFEMYVFQFSKTKAPLSGWRSNGSRDNSRDVFFSYFVEHD